MIREAAVASRASPAGGPLAELAGELLVGGLQGLCGLLEERGHALDALNGLGRTQRLVIVPNAA
ncbi:hypothetical protein [Microbacterium lacticum]